MGLSVELERRFERYCDLIVNELSHADRAQPARWYMKGLLLPGQRKSIEPMAARVQPGQVRSAHQSMHHLVADAPWSDDAVLSTVAQAVLPKLLAAGEPVYWIVDDTGFPKKGTYSVGVARQYCGQTGKRDNCRVAVSLSLAGERGSVPVGYRLYLPQEWADDDARRGKTGVPEEVQFTTKPHLAMQQIEAALAAGYPRGVVLADAAYGDETAWRERLAEHGLTYAVGARPGTTVWWGEYQPLSEPTPLDTPRGRPRRRLKRDDAHQPIALADVARVLPRQAWREVTWCEGTAGPLRSRFARLRVRAAHRDKPREQEWLIIEWPEGAKEPEHYWFSNQPSHLAWRPMIQAIKGRWRIERDYQELKQELGLGHYEGRNWRGFHHHASLCIAAYGFLILERLAGIKKNAAGFKAPALSKGFKPRGSGAHAAAPARIHRLVPLSTGTHDRKNFANMSVLRAV
jgi:SRSO17 transposase